jgi:hypothetical protein
MVVDLNRIRKNINFWGAIISMILLADLAIRAMTLATIYEWI